MAFLNNLISGISLGSVYAIIALGYTMVYGIAKMLNFAHGDVIMIGAYVSFCTTSYLGLSPSLNALPTSPCVRRRPSPSSLPPSAFPTSCKMPRS